MVKQKGILWICEACDMFYKKRELAQKCEDFCNKNHQCSLEITKHAVQK